MKLARLLKWPEINLAIFAFLLNLVWEMWQVPFFLGIGEQPHWQGIKLCTWATMGDVEITLAAFWVTAIVARSRNWLVHPGRLYLFIFVGTGLAATILFEALALGPLERWSYSDTMPRLPILGTGLLPLLQWLVLPPLIIWFARRQMGASLHASL